MKNKKILLSILCLATVVGCNTEGATSSSTKDPQVSSSSTATPDDTSSSSTGKVDSSSTTTPDDSSSTTPDDTSSSTVVEDSVPDGAVSLGFVEEPNLPADTYGYWNDQWWVGSNVVVHKAYLYENVAVFDYEYSPESATDWGFQVFYDNTTLEAGKTYVLTMNVNSEDACKIKVNNASFNLVAGDNSINVLYVEPETGKGSISMQLDKSEDLRNTVKISNTNWEVTVSQLSAPEGIVIAKEPTDNSNVIQFASVDGATGYTVVYVDSETGEEVTREDIASPGAKLSATLEDGTYKVHVIAKGDGVNYSDSPLSPTFAYLLVGEIEEVDPSERVEIVFGEENNLPLNAYVFWNDQWWVGSNVVVHEAYLLNNEAVFDYEYSPESTTDWGFQVFYKNATLTQGKTYKLTLNINSEDAINAKVNGSVVSLVAGDNSIEVEYTEGGAANASLSIQFDKSEDLRNTVKLTNVNWEETSTGGTTQPGGSVEDSNKLSIAGAVINPVNEGHIFACAPVDGATGFHLQVLNSDGDVVAEQDITNGGLITCTSELEAGVYTIQVKAISGDETIEDSDYVVVTTNYEVKETSSGEEDTNTPQEPVVDGQPIAIDATQTKVEGAGIMIYLADKPAITVDDINVVIVSFESTDYAGYKDAVMSGVNKVHYIADTGYFYATVANGFPNGSDVVMVVNISYTLDGVTYSQNLTFVGNAYQA